LLELLFVYSLSGSQRGCRLVIATEKIIEGCIQHFGKCVYLNIGYGSLI